MSLVIGFSDSDDFASELPFNDYSDPTIGYSIRGGDFDECADARKRQTQARKDLNTCLDGDRNIWAKIGDIAGCAIGVFIGRPCKTK